jgi:clan AA aspartic protease
MGLVYADIEILSSYDLELNRRGKLAKEDVKRVAVRALVDSGAYMLSINENIKAQLDLTVIEEQIAELADGSRVKLEVVGPVDVRFANRSTSARALVLPGDSEVLLGAIPMEDLDVVIEPKNQTLAVNPAHPNMAEKKLK